MEFLENKIEILGKYYKMQKRWKKMRNIVNSQKRKLVAYYPGFGDDIEVARKLGIKFQIGVEKNPADVDVELQHENYKEVIVKKGLTQINYLQSDARIFIPPELEMGIDVFINKIWLQEDGFRAFSFIKPNIRAKIYNAIRKGGFEINLGELPMFRNLNPELFKYQLILDVDTTIESGRNPGRFKLYKKQSDIYLPEEVFEIDRILTEETPGRNGNGLFYDIFPRQLEILNSGCRVNRYSPDVLEYLGDEIGMLERRNELFLSNEVEIRQKNLEKLLMMADTIKPQVLKENVMRELYSILS